MAKLMELFLWLFQFENDRIARVSPPGSGEDWGTVATFDIHPKTYLHPHPSLVDPTFTDGTNSPTTPENQLHR